MSTPLVLERKSYHVTMAPPAPSLAIRGNACVNGAVTRAAPFTGHAGSTTPEASTCWA